MLLREVCPQYTSPKYKKNGHLHNGKQSHHGHACGRQGVPYCEPYLLSEDSRGLRERLLMERMSLRGICRAVGVTRTGLLGLLRQCVAALPAPLHVQPRTGHGPVRLRRLEGKRRPWPAWYSPRPTRKGGGAPRLPRAARGLLGMAGSTVGGGRSA